MQNGTSDKVVMYRNGANTRPGKNSSHIAEHGHQAIRQVTRLRRDFKSFHCAGCVLAGV